MSSIDEKLANATSAAEVLALLGEKDASPAPTPVAAATPQPAEALLAPPTRRSEAPKYPSASIAGDKSYWGAHATWDGDLPADSNLGGGMPAEVYAARLRTSSTGPLAGPLEAAIEAAQTPAEVMALLRETQGQTGVHLEED